MRSCSSSSRRASRRSAARAALELAAYTNAAGEERIWQAFGGAAVVRRRGGLGGPLAPVPQAGPRRLALDRPAVGGARRGRDRGRDRPGPRVRHRRASDDAALPAAARRRGAGERARRRLRLRRPLDRGREARLRARARVRLRSAGRRGDRAERRRQRRLDRRQAGRSARGRAARRRPRAREHRRRGGASRSAPRLRARARDHVRLPRLRRARARRLPQRAPRPVGRLGGGSARRVSRFSGSMASFSVRFLGCKVSQTDAQALRERLLRDGHREVDGGGDVAVVNTCCVTNEGLAKSRQAAARAARSHARVYVTGCGARLSETAFAGLPANVTVVPGQIEQAVETVAGDVGAIGCVQADAQARPRSRVREDPGRLLVLVRVLRDPARARRDAQPQRRRRARRDPPARRAGPPRDRPHRRQPRLLPRPRRRA